MKKSILSIVLTLALLMSMTAPAMAATKPSTKTVTFNAGTYYEYDGLDSDATIKVTNVTSVKKKDFSFYMSDDDVTISGENSNVITCKGKTTVTLVPPKGCETDAAFDFRYSFDTNKIKASTVTAKYKYYSNNAEIEQVDTSKKYNKAPEGGCVVADGSTLTFTKAGTYVVYVRPYQFYGVNGEGYELNPVFIVVKK